MDRAYIIIRDTFLLDIYLRRTKLNNRKTIIAKCHRSNYLFDLSHDCYQTPLCVLLLVHGKRFDRRYFAGRPNTIEHVPIDVPFSLALSPTLCQKCAPMPLRYRQPNNGATRIPDASSAAHRDQQIIYRSILLCGHFRGFQKIMVGNQRPG